MSSPRFNAKLCPFLGSHLWFSGHWVQKVLGCFPHILATTIGPMNTSPRHLPCDIQIPFNFQMVSLIFKVNEVQKIISCFLIQRGTPALTIIVMNIPGIHIGGWGSMTVWSPQNSREIVVSVYVQIACMTWILMMIGRRKFFKNTLLQILHNVNSNQGTTAGQHTSSFIYWVECGDFYGL